MDQYLQMNSTSSRSTASAPAADVPGRRRLSPATPELPAVRPVEGVLFVALVALLAFAPWPPGANRPWAWSELFLIASGLLLLVATALAFGRMRAAPVPAAVGLAALLGLAVVAWILLQTVPTPWPELAHPIWALLPSELAARPAIAIDPPRAREAAYNC
jgi:lysylphosphatidylglycerol synthetase-like protein (DUF2156 family)